MKNKRSVVVDILFFLGAALISIGIGLWVHFAAGLVSAGVFCILGSFLTDTGSVKNGGDENDLV